MGYEVIFAECVVADYEVAVFADRETARFGNDFSFAKEFYAFPNGVVGDCTGLCNGVYGRITGVRFVTAFEYVA